MAEINIPMRTKASMDLGAVLRDNGEERIRPALTLGNVQAGMQQGQNGRQSSSAWQGQGVQQERQNGLQNSGVPQGTRNGLQNSGMQQGTQNGLQNSGMPQGTQNGLQNSEIQQGRSSQRRMPCAVRHYEVQPEGGTVLNKGGKVSFRSLFPDNLKKIELVMGWDAESFSLDDVDASCYLLGEDGKVIGDDWFVFYNQPSSPDGSVRHQGKGKNNEEILIIDFQRLRPEVKRLAFVLTINEARERGYSFSQVGNAHVRIRDSVSSREIALFNLSDYYDGVTAMTVCEFYDYHGEWKINPVGHGLKNTGLVELCQFYGVRVE